MKLTGNEPINPLYEEGYLKPSQNDEMGLKWMNANKPFIGLTIRQHFAAMADVSWLTLTSILHRRGVKHEEITIEMIVKTKAEYKVMEADALIAELNKN